MPTYQAPLKDTLFLLNEVFPMEHFKTLDGFADLTPDLLEAILGEAARFCEQTLQPLNSVGDLEGCHRLDDGSVTTPKGFKEAFGLFAEGGWSGLSADPAYGGQGLPGTLSSIVQEFIYAANFSWGLYPVLSQGAYAALKVHASEELRQIYLPPLASGKWTGTMNMTEPHAGTDLGLLKTKALPQADGSYNITGQKIFISSGEHDLAENIVHLVLARIDGAPDGVKGLSLFVVPKFIPDADGNPGQRNALQCGSLEEKMGIHGNATCTMNYDGAAGWLIGEEDRGLPAMFVMMNEARLSVGIQGLGISEVAYQNAASYARERLQGRALGKPKDSDAKPDPLVVHPDIRRMLMNMRAFNEGARALMIWTALKADELHKSEDAAIRQAADDHLGLMTPVIKGVFTDAGFANAVQAQQVFGGHGYITELGIEQFVRDARIAMIYEGTNGIQALDLVGRKLPKDGGRALKTFLTEVTLFLADMKKDDAFAVYGEPLGMAVDDLQSATVWLMENSIAEPDNAGAAANDYMHLLGLVSLGYMWALMAKVSQERLTDETGDRAFFEAKLTTGRYFMERCLPKTQTHLTRICSGAESMMALPAEAF
ncbi:acyl-CoA dehydrogenase C-terminal domain-containing protein [Pararhizobium sp. IMCC21322]|uniref:acyl-CoA dehydrogenase C-terminal domain-containing protein n=1 Tax=Pararhizobium sp. IMCC21322 TaxID=3067903 RepID=UPI002740A749|nr:acyl-CoA dehydrogenase C-terminal domain-containing protein [Pararhizobium sp. IMCC21322]